MLVHTCTVPYIMTHVHVARSWNNNSLFVPVNVDVFPDNQQPNHYDLNIDPPVIKRDKPIPKEIEKDRGQPLDDEAPNQDTGLEIEEVVDKEEVVHKEEVVDKEEDLSLIHI